MSVPIHMSSLVKSRHSVWGAPLRSHDRERGGDLGAAEIESGCKCACPDWCAAGAATRDKVTTCNRSLFKKNKCIVIVIDVVVWFLSRPRKRAHVNKCGLQAPKRKEFRSRLSPSVYLCDSCARVKLALYVPSIYV